MIRTRFQKAIAIAAMATAGPAVADVTAEDVWANSSAAVAAFGGTQQAELLRDGNLVRVRGHSGAFALPLGVGRITFSASDYAMIEEDGATSIIYPAPFELRLGLESPGQGTARATLRIGPNPITTRATGEPGAISYATETGPISMVVTDLHIPTDPDATAIMRLEIEGNRTETRIVEDSLLVLYARSEADGATFFTEVTDGDTLLTRTTTESGPSSATINMGLLPGGADILDLSDALRDGMYLSAQSNAGPTRSHTLAMSDGRIVQDQGYSIESGSLGLDMDASELSVSLGVGSLIFDLMQESMTPRSMGIDISQFGIDIGIPLIAMADPQPFDIDVTLDQFRLGPTIWALFDPDKALPRGPASFDLQVSGNAILDADLPDFLSLPQLGGRQEAALQVTDVDIERFGLSALGVTADSTGSFELDYGDYALIPGAPWPTGEGQAEIRGLNGLIDALLEAGFIDSELVFGLRLMIGLGAVVAGDDLLRSEIELREDGRIIANGQPFNLP